eukprot:tig00021525_g22145.t1
MYWEGLGLGEGMQPKATRVRLTERPASATLCPPSRQAQRRVSVDERPARSAAAQPAGAERDEDSLQLSPSVTAAPRIGVGAPAGSDRQRLPSEPALAQELARGALVSPAVLAAFRAQAAASAARAAAGAATATQARGGSFRSALSALRQPGASPASAPASNPGGRAPPSPARDRGHSPAGGGAAAAQAARRRAWGSDADLSYTRPAAAPPRPAPRPSLPPTLPALLRFFRPRQAPPGPAAPAPAGDRPPDPPLAALPRRQARAAPSEVAALRSRCTAPATAGARAYPSVLFSSPLPPGLVPTRSVPRGPREGSRPIRAASNPVPPELRGGGLEPRPVPRPAPRPPPPPLRPPPRLPAPLRRRGPRRPPPGLPPGPRPGGAPGPGPPAPAGAPAGAPSRPLSAASVPAARAGPPAPLSPAERAAAAILGADFLLVSAGAGFSADCGLAVYKDIADVPPYRRMGLTYADLCDPKWIQDDPEIFYGFWGSCFNSYLDSKPHEGYAILARWKAALFDGSYSRPRRDSRRARAGSAARRPPSAPAGGSATAAAAASAPGEGAEGRRGAARGTRSDGTSDAFFVYTSNVDSMFPRSGFLQGREVHEIHGSVMEWQCARPCRPDVAWRISPAFRFEVDAGTMRAPAAKKGPPGEPYADYAGGRENHVRCKFCGGAARPNVLMFEDGAWVERDDGPYRRWERRVRRALREDPGRRLVVLEAGCGLRVPTVRRNSERLLRETADRGTTLVRINPDHPAVTGAPPHAFVSLRDSALSALRRLDGYIRALGPGPPEGPAPAGPAAPAPPSAERDAEEE